MLAKWSRIAGSRSGPTAFLNCLNAGSDVLAVKTFSASSSIGFLSRSSELERLAQLGNCGVDFRRHCLEDTEPALTPYVASLQPKSPADLIKVEVLPAQLGYLDSLLHGPVGIEMGLPSLSVSQPFARSGGHDEPTFAPVLEPGPQRRKLRGRQPVQNLLFR